MLTIKINDVEANCFTLSFIDHYESEFLKDYSNKSVYHSRIALMLAMFFYGIFGILDAWLAPEEKISLWIIRYVIFIPYTLMVIFFTFSRRFKGLMQAANASVVLLAGVGIICMIMIAPANVSNSYYAGLILVFIIG